MALFFLVITTFENEKQHLKEISTENIPKEIYNRTMLLNMEIIRIRKVTIYSVTIEEFRK